MLKHHNILIFTVTCYPNGFSRPDTFYRQPQITQKQKNNKSLLICTEPKKYDQLQRGRTKSKLPHTQNSFVRPIYTNIKLT